MLFPLPGGGHIISRTRETGIADFHIIGTRLTDVYSQPVSFIGRGEGNGSFAVRRICFDQTITFSLRHTIISYFRACHRMSRQAVDDIDFLFSAGQSQGYGLQGGNISFSISCILAMAVGDRF